MSSDFGSLVRMTSELGNQMSGWMRKISPRGVVYYVHRHSGESRWDHPGLSAVLSSLSRYDNIRYAAYRLSSKLITLSEALGTANIPLNTAIKVTSHHGIQAPSIILDSQHLREILHDLFSTHQVRGMPVHIQHTNLIFTEAFANYVEQLLDPAHQGGVTSLGFKTVLAVMCRARLKEKLIYLFREHCDQKARLGRTQLTYLLTILSRIPEVLGEAAMFGTNSIVPRGVEACLQTAAACTTGSSSADEPAAGESADQKQNGADCWSRLEGITVTEETWLKWAGREPVELVWLTTAYRQQSSAGIKHGLACSACAQHVVGLRYQCLQCLNYDMCQSCFFTGSASRGHKPKHPVQEYCYPSTKKEEARAFLATLFNKLRPKPGGRLLTKSKSWSSCATAPFATLTKQPPGGGSGATSNRQTAATAGGNNKVNAANKRVLTRRLTVDRVQGAQMIDEYRANSTANNMRHYSSLHWDHHGESQGTLARGGGSAHRRLSREQRSSSLGAETKYKDQTSSTAADGGGYERLVFDRDAAAEGQQSSSSGLVHHPRPHKLLSRSDLIRRPTRTGSASRRQRRPSDNSDENTDEMDGGGGGKEFENVPDHHESRVGKCAKISQINVVNNNNNNNPLLLSPIYESPLRQFCTDAVPPDNHRRQEIVSACRRLDMDNAHLDVVVAAVGGGAAVVVGSDESERRSSPSCSSSGFCSASDESSHNNNNNNHHHSSDNSQVGVGSSQEGESRCTCSPRSTPDDDLDLMSEAEQEGSSGGGGDVDVWQGVAQDRRRSSKPCMCQQRNGDSSDGANNINNNHTSSQKSCHQRRSEHQGGLFRRTLSHSDAVKIEGSERGQQALLEPGPGSCGSSVNSDHSCDSLSLEGQGSRRNSLGVSRESMLTSLGSGAGCVGAGAADLEWDDAGIQLNEDLQQPQHNLSFWRSGGGQAFEHSILRRDLDTGEMMVYRDQGVAAASSFIVPDHDERPRNHPRFGAGAGGIEDNNVSRRGSREEEMYSILGHLETDERRLTDKLKQSPDLAEPIIEARAQLGRLKHLMLNIFGAANKEANNRGRVQGGPSEAGDVFEVNPDRDGPPSLALNMTDLIEDKIEAAQEEQEQKLDLTHGGEVGSGHHHHQQTTPGDADRLLSGISSNGHRRVDRRLSFRESTRLWDTTANANHNSLSAMANPPPSQQPAAAASRITKTLFGGLINSEGELLFSPVVFDSDGPEAGKRSKTLSESNTTGRLGSETEDHEASLYSTEKSLTRYSLADLSRRLGGTGLSYSQDSLLEISKRLGEGDMGKGDGDSPMDESVGQRSFRDAVDELERLMHNLTQIFDGFHPQPNQENGDGHDSRKSSNNSVWATSPTSKPGNPDVMTSMAAAADVNKTGGNPAANNQTIMMIVNEIGRLLAVTKETQI